MANALISSLLAPRAARVVRADGRVVALSGGASPDGRVPVRFEDRVVGYVAGEDAAALAPMVAPVLAAPDLGWALACLAAIARLREAHPHVDWIGVYRRDADALVLTAQLGQAADHLRMPPDDGLCWQAVRTGRAIYVPDTATRADFVPCEFPARSSLMVPIGTVGLIEVDALAPQAYPPAVVAAVEEAAAALAAAWPAPKPPGPYPADASSTFERAVDAVVLGDEATLEVLLRADPTLVHARSTHTTPPMTPLLGATLLHYVGANGVEDYRQRTPANALAIARRLLAAGAAVDAPAHIYGPTATALELLVTSCWPAEAGLQAPLAELLAAHGAALASSLRGALAFGYLVTADALVRAGAAVTELPVATGLGDRAAVQALLPAADADTRQAALALAAQHGHAGLVDLLLDAGADPARFNPVGYHAHSTPLHQAALSGHLDVVQRLVARGAPLDVRDKAHDGTPLGWARHGEQPEVVAFLEAS